MARRYVPDRGDLKSRGRKSEVRIKVASDGA